MATDLGSALFCRKLRYIAEEMINTEKDYVRSLEYILKVSTDNKLFIDYKAPFLHKPKIFLK